MARELKFKMALAHISIVRTTYIHVPRQDDSDDGILAASNYVIDEEDLKAEQWYFTKIVDMDGVSQNTAFNASHHSIGLPWKDLVCLAEKLYGFLQRQHPGFEVFLTTFTHFFSITAGMLLDTSPNYLPHWTLMEPPSKELDILTISIQRGGGVSMLKEKCVFSNPLLAPLIRKSLD